MERTGQPAASIPSAGGPEALELGATMREMRLAHKRTLADVAAELRIRATFLQAIEEGRFADLPGMTYALGFVRAYADYLGLDSNDAVRRFKAASGVDAVQHNLVLPSPMAEGRLPTGAVMLVAVALAIGVYGGWYALTTEGHDAGTVVAALPGRIVQMVRDAIPERAPDEEPAAAAMARTGPAPTGAAPAATDKDKSASDAKALAAAAPPVGSAAEAENDEPVDDDEDTAPEPPEQVVQAEPSASAGPVAPASAPRGDRSAAALPAPPPAPPGSFLPRPQAGGTAAADTGGAHRIVLVARSDSWVELRDMAGAPIYSRVLRTGERYEVPQQLGLVMMTGNAGGVDVLVDGQAAPPLGAPGAVKRNIALDAERLMAGTAAPPATP